MPDLRDGESIEMQGSASRPYQLKNVGGVYSCSCPAWRNQSLPIERRSCKHLRRLRGDEAEQARVGSHLSSTPAKGGSTKPGPPLLLAESWDGDSDIRGYWFSEKLDGVSCYWDGERFLSRLGNPFHAPAWFTAGLPAEPLDGELWLGRKKFQRTVSIVRRHDESELWKEVRYLVFDAPGLEKDFEDRLHFVETLMQERRPAYASAHPHISCRGIDHLKQELARIEALGGEGLMLRQPGSWYVAGRSATLLKVKSFQDAEATGHWPRAGPRTAQRPPGRLACRDAQWHSLRCRHRALGCRAPEPAARGQRDSFPLPGVVRRRRAPVPVVRRNSQRLLSYHSHRRRRAYRWQLHRPQGVSSLSAVAQTSSGRYRWPARKSPFASAATGRTAKPT